ncbi:MAG: hypothetical protein VW684_12205, partial [Betaproteobacteria bacterium]
KPTGDYLGRHIINLGGGEFFIHWSYSRNHPQLAHVRQEGQRFSYDGSPLGNAVVIAQSSTNSDTSGWSVEIPQLIRLSDDSLLALVGDASSGERFDLSMVRFDVS